MFQDCIFNFFLNVIYSDHIKLVGNINLSFELYGKNCCWKYYSQPSTSGTMYSFFLNKNKLNKNTEAEIAQKNKNKLRTD